MAPRKKRKKKIEVNNLKELKSYINGAIEFNEEGWYPNQEQWENIVEIIMKLPDEQPIQQVVQQRPSGGQQQVVPAGPSQLEAPRTPNYPAPKEPIQNESQAPKIDMRKLQVERTHGGGTKDPETGAVSSGIKVKTPSIDTSDGNGYTSTFE